MANSAYKTAVSYLSRGIKSKRQVENKLKEKGFSNSEIEGTISRIEDEGYIDDEYFAKVVSDRLILRGRGKEKVKSELRAKGISAEIISIVLEEKFDYESEIKRGLGLAVKIIEFDGLKKDGEVMMKKDREKLIRKLMNRGYSPRYAVKIAEILNNSVDIFDVEL